MVITTNNIILQFLIKFEAYPIDCTLFGVKAFGIVWSNLLFWVYSLSSKLILSPLTPLSWVRGAKYVLIESIFEREKNEICKTPKS